MKRSSVRSLLPLAGVFLGLAASVPSQKPREATVNLEASETDLAEVVESLRWQSGTNLVVAPGVSAKVTLTLRDVPWRTALDLVAENAGCVLVPLAANVFKFEKPPPVDFSFQEADVRKVIEMIATFGGANIVVAPDVSGVVSIRLRAIPWRDALQAVAKTANLAVVEEARGILSVIQASALQEQIEIRAFQLRWIRPPSTYTPKIESEFVISPFSGRGAQGLGGGAAGAQGQTAAERVKREFTLLQALEKMLSSKGKLDYIDRQNVLVVRDVPTVIESIATILAIMDVEPQQVMVDVKFISVADSDLFDFGVNYGETGPSATFQGGEIPVDFPFKVDDLDADGSLTPFPPIAAPDPTITFGTLSFAQLQATIRLLRRDKRNEIVQAPQVIALDHQPATIFVGEEIRFAVVRAEQGQAGGLAQAIEEAPSSPVKVGFQLLIIPHVVPESNKVLMDIIPKQDALSGTGGPPLAPPGFDVFTVGTGDTGPGTIALPRIASSTVATTIMLESGQTAALGGLKTDTDQEIVSKVPLLGDIPLLGALFRHTQSTKERRDLLVFVTPSILRTSADADAWLEREIKRRHERIRREHAEAKGAPIETAGSPAVGAGPLLPSAGSR